MEEAILRERVWVWGVPFAPITLGAGGRRRLGADPRRSPEFLHHGPDSLRHADRLAARPPGDQRAGGVHRGRRGPAGLGVATAGDAAAGAGGGLGPDLPPLRGGGPGGLPGLPAGRGRGGGGAGGGAADRERTRASRSSGPSARPSATRLPRKRMRSSSASDGPGPISCSWRSASPRESGGSSARSMRLGVPVSVQVGASLDFAAGRVRRAPRWMQKTGLEWAFRLGLEPRRLFGRYASNAWFIARMVGKDLRRSVGRRESDDGRRPTDIRTTGQIW